MRNRLVTISGSLLLQSQTLEAPVADNPWGGNDGDPAEGGERSHVPGANLAAESGSGPSARLHHSPSPGRRPVRGTWTGSAPLAPPTPFLPITEARSIRGVSR